MGKTNLSIVITAFKEKETIGKAIESITSQKIESNYELVVSAPDEETLFIVKEYAKKNKKIKSFKDPGKGKSFALNILLKKLKGEILIFTDGDVYVSNNSINEIYACFNDKKVGCVTGRPVPIEDKKTKYGYWANFLFDSAHRLRERLNEANQFLECSGYLWAFRNNVISEFPLDAAEDSIVPLLFYEKGYKIRYAKGARVYVKNVNNWKDWINQKTRTTKAHETLGKYTGKIKIPKTKTFLNEAKGAFNLFLYPKNIFELFWSLELFFARFYMWFEVFIETKIKKKKYQDAWERIESTK
jgi:cellulose synthase/poly-beta-1,6-N-acetylglucosamine synthase-like glycosyltransferase